MHCVLYVVMDVLIVPCGIGEIRIIRTDTYYVTLFFCSGIVDVSQTAAVLECTVSYVFTLLDMVTLVRLLQS